MADEIDISAIHIGDRHRKDMGDIAGLAQSIAEIGLLHSIAVTSDMRLIAGERRMRAFEYLGRTRIPARVVDIEHLAFGEQAENINRKDFTIEERVAIGERIEALLGKRQGERTDLRIEHREIFPEVRGRTRDIAAEKAGFQNARTYEQAKAVIEAGGKPLDDMNRTGRVNGPYKRVRIATQAAEIRLSPPPLPGNGPYRVIAADPPWAYEKRAEDPSHRGVHPYPTMSIADICAMRVADIAHQDSILWLWTTNHHMREAYGVLDAWGFAGITILTWVKDRFGLGDWLRGQTEHALFCTRGKPIVQLTNESTVLFAPAGRHSEKPDAFYALVEKLCPAPRYCELFARKARPNWDAHGNEAPPMEEAAE
jgi:N6-adenosine-specific RNA methylase IME4